MHYVRNDLRTNIIYKILTNKTFFNNQQFICNIFTYQKKTVILFIENITSTYYMTKISVTKCSK